jgi:translation initiation factor 1
MSATRKVYSTDQGKHCPTCEKAIQTCICSRSNNYFQGNAIVKISRETKGRKGKGVTLIAGISGTEKEIKDLAKVLKQKCSCGGAVKNGVIEIQGDHRESIKLFLESKKLTVKLAGG